MMQLPVIQRTIFGGSLRNASLLIGWFSFVGLFSGIVHSLIKMFKLAVYFHRDSNNRYWQGRMSESIVMVGIISPIFLTTLFMLIGVQKKRSKFMVPWVYGNIIGAVAAVLITFSMIWDRLSVRSELVVLAIMSAVYSYAVLIVYSYYSMLKNDQNGGTYMQQIVKNEKFNEDDYPVKTNNAPMI